MHIPIPHSHETAHLLSYHFVTLALFHLFSASPIPLLQAVTHNPERVQVVWHSPLSDSEVGFYDYALMYETARQPPKEVKALTFANRFYNIENLLHNTTYMIKVISQSRLHKRYFQMLDTIKTINIACILQNVYPSICRVCRQFYITHLTLREAICQRMHNKCVYGFHFIHRWLYAALILMTPHTGSAVIGDVKIVIL